MIEGLSQPPVRSRVWTQDDAKAAFALLTGDPAQYAVYGREYETESQARTQGQALDRMIKALYQRRFGVTVWVENGKHCGALAPKPPVVRREKAKGAAKK